jgi:vacuolar iron transporter family protein
LGYPDEDEELGIDPNELGGSPWVAAAMSFGLSIAGAIFPVAPFAFLQGNAAVLGCLTVLGIAD